MRIVIVVFFFLISLQITAQHQAVRRHSHRRDTIVRNKMPHIIDSIERTKYESSTISMQYFFKDTLQSDSFFNVKFAKYRAPMPHLGYEFTDGKGSNKVGLSKQIFSRSWVALALGIAVILLLFIKFNFSKLYKNAILSFYRRTATTEIINDKYSPRWLFVIFTNLFFISVISLWICRVYLSIETPLKDEEPDRFLWVLGSVCAIYLIKYIIHLLAGVLFQIREAISIYILNISITNLLCGISMLFLTLLLLYSPWKEEPILLRISFGIVIIFILLRYLRGLFQTIQYFKYNYLYLILYLCTLEIAPWFFIVKYLNNYL